LYGVKVLLSTVNLNEPHTSICFSSRHTHIFLFFLVDNTHIFVFDLKFLFFSLKLNHGAGMLIEHEVASILIHSREIGDDAIVLEAHRAGAGVELWNDKDKHADNVVLIGGSNTPLKRDYHGVVMLSEHHIEVRIYTHTHIHTHAHTHTHVHMYLHTCTHAYTYAQTDCPTTTNTITFTQS